MPSFGKSNDTYNKILKNTIHAIEQNEQSLYTKACLVDSVLTLQPSSNPFESSSSVRQGKREG